MNKIRVFIAIGLNNDLRNSIKSIQKNIKNLNCNIKWVKSNNAHITLKFLGNINTNKIELIKFILNEITQELRPFQFETSKISAFPNIKKPQAIWIEIYDNNILLHLAAKIEKKLINIGIKRNEKNFRPHITIGRAKTNKNLSALAKYLQNYRIEERIICNVKEIQFIKSTLTSVGPVYQIIKKIPLK